jgi:SAM-dependent methyltransferase
MSMVELHRLMLRDGVRNAAYARALEATVTKDDRVLDLGAGTGFLSMLAARAGAKQVIAVEAAEIAKLGQGITKDNGFSDRIVWKKVPSVELELKQKATVLVTETFGSHPFEECVHEFVRDARQRLCVPDARIIPSRVRVYAAPASFAEKRDDWDLFSGKISGFSFAALRPFTVSAMYAEVLPPDALLSEPALLEDIELGGKTPSRRKLSAEWRTEKAGPLSGVVQWYELDLAPGIVLSTAPSAPLTHWRQIHYPMKENRSVKKGQTVTLTIALDTRVEVPLSLDFQITVR